MHESLSSGLLEANMTSSGRSTSTGIAATTSANLSDLLDALHVEISIIQNTWTLWKQLFSVDLAMVTKMNRLAPRFFGRVQFAQMHEATLGLCRLNDPAFTGKCPNQSLLQLYDQARQVLGAQCPSALKCQIDLFIQTMLPIKNLRDKHLAHRDLIGAMAKAKFEFPIVAIDDALKLATKIVELVERQLLGYRRPLCEPSDVVQETLSFINSL